MRILKAHDRVALRGQRVSANCISKVLTRAERTTELFIVLEEVTRVNFRVLVFGFRTAQFEVIQTGLPVFLLWVCDSYCSRWFRGNDFYRFWRLFFIAV